MRHPTNVPPGVDTWMGNGAFVFYWGETAASRPAAFGVIGITIAFRLKMQNHNLYDDGAPVEQARERIHELLINLRKDGLKLDNPQASALFETSAEVLAGLERAFEHYATKSETAWRK